MTPVVPLLRTAGRDDSDHAHPSIAVSSTRTTDPDLLPPVVSVQSALHGWVAYGVMPLFALANAGVSLSGLGVGAQAHAAVATGIVLGLLVGKPVGILLISWTTIRLGWCTLPSDIGWRGMMLIAVLGAIGFTMSIFIAALAFADESMLATAKLAVLIASGIAAILALGLGKYLFRGVPPG
jgi:NhaA family Na+:H+ antiporter